MKINVKYQDQQNRQVAMHNEADKEMRLKVEGITGGYSTTPVIHDINFELFSHEIVALIGLNGAGKSTLIKHILGLLHPHQGKVEIDGRTIAEDIDHYRSLFSYIPEMPVYYEELNLYEHLKLLAQIYNLPQDHFDKKVDELLKEFRMEHARNRFPHQFSKGMRQKLMIMMALLTQPKLYIIDEPLLGLDPLGIRSLLNALKKCRDQGAAVLMSTHILATAQDYCDRFIIIHEGHIKAVGSLEQLREQTGMHQASLDQIYVHLTIGDEADHG